MAQGYVDTKARSPASLGELRVEIREKRLSWPAVLDPVLGDRRLRIPAGPITVAVGRGHISCGRPMNEFVINLLLMSTCCIALPNLNYYLAGWLVHGYHKSRDPAGGGHSSRRVVARADGREDGAGTRHPVGRCSAASSHAAAVPGMRIVARPPRAMRRHWLVAGSAGPAAAAAAPSIASIQYDSASRPTAARLSPPPPSVTSVSGRAAVPAWASSVTGSGRQGYFKGGGRRRRVAH